MPDKSRCECPEYGVAAEADLYLYQEEEYKGMTHDPNECLGDYDLKQYIREGKILWLCSCCCLFGDVPVFKN